MEHIKHDELNQILDKTNGWINNCDSKVSIVLSGMGVFAVILLATDYISKFILIYKFMCEKINIWSVIYLILNFSALFLLIYGTFLLVRVLFANINSKDFDNKDIKKDSLIFFSSIAKNTTLSKYRTRLKKCTYEQLNDDLISQIYICSLICDKKFALYNKGLRLAIIGFSLFIAMIFIGAVVSYISIM